MKTTKTIKNEWNGTDYYDTSDGTKTLIARTSREDEEITIMRFCHNGNCLEWKVAIPDNAPKSIFEAALLEATKI